MMRSYRWTGFAAAWLMVPHVVTSTFRLAGDTGISLWDQVVEYLRNCEYSVGAIVGFCRFIVVLLLLMQAARRGSIGVRTSE